MKKGYNPLAYRLFCLQSHYKNQLVFTYESLDIAQNSYNKLVSKINSLKQDKAMIDKEVYEKYDSMFKEALSDNLNTSNAITVLYDVLKADTNNSTKLALIESFDKVLSLDLIKEEIEEEIDSELLKYINTSIEKRKKAKLDKDYELADSIRKELLEKGIVLKDTREGTIFEVIK
jgi:cysteinyl-tRNA synthetase